MTDVQLKFDDPVFGFDREKAIRRLDSLKQVCQSLERRAVDDGVGALWARRTATLDAAITVLRAGCGEVEELCALAARLRRMEKAFFELSTRSHDLGIGELWRARAAGPVQAAQVLEDATAIDGSAYAWTLQFQGVKETLERWLLDSGAADAMCQNESCPRVVHNPPRELWAGFPKARVNRAVPIGTGKFRCGVELLPGMLEVVSVYELTLREVPDVE